MFYQIPKIKFTKIIRRLYYSYLLIIYLIIGFLNVVDLEFFKELGKVTEAIESKRRIGFDFKINDNSETIKIKTIKS